MTRPHLQAAPNITPLIDVLLVLLIIFMFTVRLTQVGLDVSLPGEAGSGHADPQIVLQYSAERQLTLNSQPVPRHALADRLREVYRARRDKTMWLEGAGSLRYGEIVDVIDAAKGAGVERVGVITPEMRKR